MREVIFYKSYFQDFYDSLDNRIRNKFEYVLLILETQPVVPQKFVKHIAGSTGIYEIRIGVGSNEYRVLFFFESGSLIEGGKIVVVGNGFLKKSDRDYPRAIELAENIKAEYFAELKDADSNSIDAK